MIAALALLCAGCGHSTINVRGGGGAPLAAPPPGTSVSGGSASVSIGRGGDAATLLGLGLLIGIAYGAEHQQRPAVVMDPTRLVHEQDCSKPIENPGANLKCR